MIYKKLRTFFITLLKNASNYGYKVALSLSDSFCVERHREDFLKLINNKISILFSNTNEIETLYECERIKAMGKATRTVDIVITTMGKNGSSLLKDNDYT